MTCRCAPALVALRSEVNERWPNRDKASDGCCGDAAHAARKSDHNPDGAGYAHAHDFDEDIAAGDRPLWDTLLPIVLADDRTKYVIYERRIMYPDGTNKPYKGPNAHDHHMHVSIKPTATHDTRRWLPELHAAKAEEDDMFTDDDRARLDEIEKLLLGINHQVVAKEGRLYRATVAAEAVGSLVAKIASKVGVK